MSETRNWAERSWKVFPGGSLGEYDLPRELSRVLTHGRGSRVYDTEKREYVDYTMGWGSVLLGHAHPAVVEAVTRQAAKGSNFSYVTEPALELAEEIVRAVPSAEKVRFCASGTEATMYAARFARAFKRRPKILKFEGAYHGANEFGSISLFPKTLIDFPRANPTSAGIPASTCDDVLVAPYNDIETTTRIISEHRDSLAAVIVEPFHRCTSPVPGFLEGLRHATRENDVLLIFDEVVTGFRFSYGGAQKYYGVTPDLTALGKGLGGGYPVGAITGRGEILDLCEEATLGRDGYVWFAATLGGNPITAVAALATLGQMRAPGVYERFFSMGEKMRSGFRAILNELDIAAQVLGDGPLCALSFTGQKIVDYRTALAADGAKARKFTLGLFQRGVFLNPMSTKLYLSLSHTDEDLARLHAAARETLAELR